MNPRIHISPENQRPVPRLALRPQEAADSLGMSLTTFNDLVRDGIMPKAIPLPGHAGVALYDFEAVRNAWTALCDAAQNGQDLWGSVK